MRAGKFILGIHALEAIAAAALDPRECKLLLASMAIEKIRQQEAALDTPCGATYRARYIEDIQFVAMAEPSCGYFLEYKVGPNPVVEDSSKYQYYRWFARFNEEGKMVQISPVIMDPFIED